MVNQKSLKDQNIISLIAILTADLIVLIVVVKTNQIVADDYQNVLHQWSALLPAGFGAVLIGVVNGLLSADAKARIVFWRWSNPLPGSEAFSRHASRDPRIDIAALEEKNGGLSIGTTRPERALV